MQDKKVIVSSTTSPRNNIENDLIKDDDFLVVGKHDKKISLFEQGKNIPIISLPTYVNQSENRGYLKIPTDRENDFIVQWGTINLLSESTVTGDFNIAFPNRCNAIYGSHKLNNLGTIIMIDSISNSQFQVSIVGGVDNELIQWFALGY